jgi:ABC-type histidine transport system ATPase subunit
VIFLAEGSIHEQGASDDVLKQPKHERTKAFLASQQRFRF